MFWKRWIENGLYTGDLYKDGIFKSFVELVKKLNLREKGDFWKHLQIRHCMMDYQPNKAGNPAADFLQNSCNYKASVFYKNSVYLTSNRCENLRIIWQIDFNCNIDQGETSRHLEVRFCLIMLNISKKLEVNLLTINFDTAFTEHHVGSIE